MQFHIRLLRATLGAAVVCLPMALLAGCENKEKVLDVETPRRHIEVDRDRDTGNVEVKGGEKKPLVKVDTPGANVDVRRDPVSGGVDVNANKK